MGIWDTCVCLTPPLHHSFFSPLSKFVSLPSFILSTRKMFKDLPAVPPLPIHQHASSLAVLEEEAVVAPSLPIRLFSLSLGPTPSDPGNSNSLNPTIYNSIVGYMLLLFSFQEKLFMLRECCMKFFDRFFGGFFFFVNVSFPPPYSALPPILLRRRVRLSYRHRNRRFPAVTSLWPTRTRRPSASANTRKCARSIRTAPHEEAP